MNEQQLSNRLEKVASFIKKDAIVADIGSDHGYLPVFLVKQGIAKEAIAGEVNEGPLKAAATQVKRNGLEGKIKTKLGDGLKVLTGEKVDTVVIAGMGGPLISKILAEGNDYLQNVNRLILQPNIAADHIRRWLIENRWILLDEVIMNEDNHIYEILVAERGDPFVPYSADQDKELWLGPYLLKEKNKAFVEKWRKELQQLENIKEQLEKSTARNEATIARKELVCQKIKWLEEALS
ncbi:tRNA (adenine(22)-N(1))-methyltransferase TrmK [Evansella sp. AB-P1]|uniref:tRNA (adenine(22)-N(1))-methyltransferase n=1 Tax=Evansella sp. AB-P1 TaxID=3037653 RepID=UPI00241ED1BB|nr:tRNA (adenine(22)-N(1))-methyltransferase TrmK [Evansella sp. AB-P1]MDG5786565.1 tRNA (adenine(22)-N(1))-methyltransferase TrmK [Evansella sp. AB-P1]